jgi:hypothetical protein
MNGVRHLDEHAWRRLAQVAWSAAWVVAGFVAGGMSFVAGPLEAAGKPSGVVGVVAKGATGVSANVSRGSMGGAGGGVGSSLAAAMYCPFCTALKPTLTEEIEATDAVVFAKVLGPGQLTEDGFDRKLRLQVQRILKGKSFVAEEEVFETIAPATLEAGQECLVMGVLTDRMMWSTPMKLTERSREYILAVQSLPLEGPDRIRFFWHYLEDAESFMAFDAYDEFARTPYDDVKAIKGEMNRDKLVSWVQDPEVSINRKRLYFTLLGVCGSKDDLSLLEKMITSSDKRDRAALDSLVACYLTLAGADGVKLIEDRFLRDKEADYVDTYAAVAALRFHGTESDVIPVPRIVEAVRLLLDRPEVADLVIADLARWKDWTVTDRLVEMFKNADDKTQWVRVPIVHYLRVNPDPIAKAKIEELKAVDPQSVRRALAFFELEAAMQTELDDEDADFERQLKELEREKTDEQKKEEQGKVEQGKEEKNKQQQGKGGEAVGPAGNPSSGPGKSTGERPRRSIDSGSAADQEPLASAANGDGTLGTGTPVGGVTIRQFVLRPVFEAQDFEVATVPAAAVGSQAGEVREGGDSQETIGAAATDQAGQEGSLAKLPPATSGNGSLGVSRTAGLPSPSRAESLAAKPNLATDRVVGAGDANRPGEQGHFWWIVGVPVAVNVLLLALSWSILNGTFGRLFC